MKKITYNQDRKIVKDYYDAPYPDYLHDTGLYELVDYLAGLCNRFIYNPLKDLEHPLNIHEINNRKDIEDKIMLYNDQDLNEYYTRVLKTIRILKKYYNDDGTLKENKMMDIKKDLESQNNSFTKYKTIILILLLIFIIIFLTFYSLCF